MAKRLTSPKVVPTGQMVLHIRRPRRAAITATTPSVIAAISVEAQVAATARPSGEPNADRTASVAGANRRWHMRE